MTATPLLVRRCPDCLDSSSHGARELLKAVSMDDDPYFMARLTTKILEDVEVMAMDLKDDYCASIHPWLPIVDPEQICSHVASLPQCGHAESGMPVWALYLVTQRACKAYGHDMRSTLYQTVKQVFILVASEDATLQRIQAGLLITYYACGQRLPRDAHMILAICVAMARLMGINFEQITDTAGLDKQHAICRWAIVILDTCVTEPSI